MQGVITRILRQFSLNSPIGGVCGGPNTICPSRKDAHKVLRATLFRFCVQPSLVAYAVGMGLQAVTID